MYVHICTRDSGARNSYILGKQIEANSGYLSIRCRHAESIATRFSARMLAAIAYIEMFSEFQE